MSHRCKTTRRMLGAAAAILMLSPGLSVQAQAQKPYPNKPITLIVPFAQGGLTDVPVRMMATIMQTNIDVPIVVENRPGGSGVIGASHVLRAAPDGYTIHANAVADTQNLHYIDVPYNAIKEFEFVGKIVEGPPLVLIINANLPYKTLGELLKDAKAHPKKISFGTSGPASSPMVALTQLNIAAGTHIQDVPYRGSGQAAAAVTTDAIQGTFTFYSSAKPLVDGGKVRPLAIAGPKRIADWPDVPTMEEAGFKGFDHSGFVGLGVPAKTPPEVIAFLNKALNEAINSDLFTTRVTALGMSVPKSSENTPAAFRTYMEEQTQRQAEFSKLVKAAIAASKQQKPDKK